MIDYTKAPGRILLLKELQEIYIDIVKNYGEEAYSSRWMRKNGYSWFPQQVSVKHKIEWNEFREKCGFDIKLKYSKKNLSLENLIEQYKKVVEEHGEKAYKSNWMQRSKYNWLYLQIKNKYEKTWKEFIKLCGFNSDKLYKINFSINDLIKEYKIIVEEHEEKAYNSSWIQKNGYYWLFSQVTRKYKMKWNEFKNKCGFNFILKKEILSLAQLKEKYKEIVLKHGKKAYSSKWIIKNNYHWLYRQVIKNHKMKWNEFKESCGIKDMLRKDLISLEEIIKEYKLIVKEHGKKAYSSGWIIKNKYGWLYWQISKKYKFKWNDFRKQCGFDFEFQKKGLSLEELIKEYKLIVKEHGEKSYSSTWMTKNGYQWLCQQVNIKYKMKWIDFRKQCGIDIELNRFMTLEVLIEEYKTRVKKYGEKAYSSGWILKSSNFGWLFNQVTRINKIPWAQFIQMCKSQIEVDFEW